MSQEPTGKVFRLQPERDGQWYLWAIGAPPVGASAIFLLVTSLILRAQDVALVGILLVVGGMVWWCRRFFGLDVVTLSHNTVVIERSVLGFVLNHSEYPAEAISKLRFAEWDAGRRGLRRELQFEYEGLKVAFGKQASAMNAGDVIDAMQAAWPQVADGADPREARR